MIRLLPFLLELIADWQLIKAGKKDLPLWLRVVLIGLLFLRIVWGKDQTGKRISMSTAWAVAKLVWL